MKKLSLVFSLAFLAAACAQPPTQEISDAQNAVTAASSAGAEDYAVEQFRAAQDALTAANSQVEAKDYKAAKTSALDAKAKAEAALTAVEAGKAQAKAMAEPKLKEVKKDADAVSTMAARVHTKAGKDLREQATGLKAQAQGLQADFDAQKYKAVLDKASDIETRLNDLKAKMGAKTPAKASAAKAPAKAPAKKKKK